MTHDRIVWRPYLAGALTGVLAIVSLLATRYLLEQASFLGASTTFVRAAGLIERIFAADHVAANEYFGRTGLEIDWQFMLIIGIFIGALLSSVLDKSYKLESVPPIWDRRFGKSIGKRATAAVLGGVVAMIGARMASGCPSGHGISGLMQLSVSGITALALFFATGIVVAHFVYKGRLQ